METKEYEYKLRAWAVVIGVSTVISSIFTPITIERFFTVFMLVVIISLFSKERENLVIPTIASSGMYWLSSFLSGTLAFLVSLSGLVFAGIIAILLVDLRDIQEAQKSKNSG